MNVIGWNVCQVSVFYFTRKTIVLVINSLSCFLYKLTKYIREQIDFDYDIHVPAKHHLKSHNWGVPVIK